MAKRSTPSSSPKRSPREDKRPQLTIKGPAITEEWHGRLNHVCELTGETQAVLVARLVEAELQRLVKGELAGQSQVPAVVNEERVAAVVAQLLPGILAAELDRRRQAEGQDEQQRQAEAQEEAEDRQVEAQAETEEQQRQAEAKRGFMGRFLRGLWGGGAKGSS